MSAEIRIWDAVPGHDWDDERDLKIQPTWSIDPTHSWPRLMAMEGWFWMKYMAQGVVHTFELISKPVVKAHLRRIRNGSDYLTNIVVTDENQIREREVVFRERIISLSADFPQWWEKSKKELMTAYEGLKAFDPDTASNMGLLDHLYELMDIARRMWRIHFLGLMVVSNAWVLLEDLFRDLWGLTDLSVEFRKIISGFDNKMLQSDRRMYQLGQSASARGIADIIENTEPKELYPKLEQSKAGKEWLKEFGDFLDEYGWRIAHGHVFHEPTWIEDPTPAIERIKGFIQKGGDFGPDKKREMLVKEREETLAALLPKVPEDQRDDFLKLLTAAQLAGVYNEEHNYYCENYCHGLIRRGLLGIGRRLVEAGAIDQAEDVLFLNPPEVEGVLPGPEGSNLRYIVDRRRREWEESHKMDAPRILTIRSSIPEAFEKDISKWKDPIQDKIIMGIVPEVKSDLNADLYGLPVSAGVAQGPARVVTAPEQLKDVKIGEILVAPFTTPTWTPVFGLISGVVTDAGGALAHTAISSREHGIPAVTNVGEGTRKIKTGQQVMVDGNEGAVYILE